jgi:hypothetical protein
MAAAAERPTALVSDGSQIVSAQIVEAVRCKPTAD